MIKHVGFVILPLLFSVVAGGLGVKIFNVEIGILIFFGLLAIVLPLTFIASSMSSLTLPYFSEEEELEEEPTIPEDMRELVENTFKGQF